MRIVYVSLLAATLAMAAGCGARPGIEDHKFEAFDGTTVDAELGTLLVKENRSKADSRDIPLRFVRFKSTSQIPGAPIVYLAGGPGGSGINSAKGSRLPLFQAMREFADVIAFDQRGTGMSGFEELDCDDRFQAPFDEPIDPEKSTAIVAKPTLDCIERKRRKGIDVDAYNTLESAADLMDLREFIGADKLTLWGISYGSHLAMATMKYHGEHVDRVILAGIEGLHHTWKLPADQQALMEQIARLSNSDQEVSKSLPDLLGTIEALLDELGSNPKIVTLTHPIENEDVDVVVGKFDLQMALANMLRGPETFGGMPDAVARLAAGDWTALALASAQQRSGEGIHSMTVAMDCASGADKEWLARIEAQANDTLLGEAINFPMRQLCDNVGIPDLGDEFRAPLRSDVPALLISGTLDGRTPVANAEKVLPGLSRANHLIIDGAGHGDPLFLSAPEILETIRAFMRGERIRDRTITLPPVRFQPPRVIANLSKETLQQYKGDYYIEDSDDVRKVVLAGGLLFTIREGGQPFPIRPTSKTDFFYEGSATYLQFDFDTDGKIKGMRMFHNGTGDGEFASKGR